MADDINEMAQEMVDEERIAKENSYKQAAGQEGKVVIRYGPDPSKPEDVRAQKQLDRIDGYARGFASFVRERVAPAAASAGRHTVEFVRKEGIPAAKRFLDTRNKQLRPTGEKRKWRGNAGQTVIIIKQASTRPALNYEARPKRMRWI